MPLIVLCGYPNAGKTIIAKRIHDYLQSKKENVVLLSREALLLQDCDERDLRITLLSEVTSRLAQDVYVIVDDSNRTKSFRYQLYQISKNIGTKYCIVHVITSRNAVLENNISNKRYLLDDLIMQMDTFEDVNPTNRWDSPCMIVKTADDISTDMIDELKGAKRTDNRSRIKVNVNSSSYLTNVKKKISEVSNKISKALSEKKSVIEIDGQKISAERFAGKNIQLYETNFIHSLRYTPVREEDVQSVYFSFLIGKI